MGETFWLSVPHKSLAYDKQKPTGFFAERGSERFLRANERYKTALGVVVTNLTKKTKAEGGLLLDISANGMRIKSCSTFRIGDAVQVNIRNSAMLAEVIHVSQAYETVEVGLKLAQSLDREKLAKYFVQFQVAP
jgi:sRNA-binding protein